MLSAQNPMLSAQNPMLSANSDVGPPMSTNGYPFWPRPNVVLLSFFGLLTSGSETVARFLAVIFI